MNTGWRQQDAKPSLTLNQIVIAKALNSVETSQGTPEPALPRLGDLLPIFLEISLTRDEITPGQKSQCI